MYAYIYIFYILKQDLCIQINSFIGEYIKQGSDDKFYRNHERFLYIFRSHPEGWEQRLLTRLGIQELNKIRELVRVFFVAAEVRGSYLCRLVTQD